MRDAVFPDINLSPQPLVDCVSANETNGTSWDKPTDRQIIYYDKPTERQITDSDRQTDRQITHSDRRTDRQTIYALRLTYRSPDYTATCNKVPSS